MQLARTKMAVLAAWVLSSTAMVVSIDAGSSSTRQLFAGLGLLFTLGALPRLAAACAAMSASIREVVD